MESLTEEVHSKSTQWSVNFPNSTPSSRTLLKWLYTPAWKQTVQGHHYNTGTNHKIQRWQAERSENYKSTTGWDPPLSDLCGFAGTLSQRITSLKWEYAERADHQTIGQPYESKFTFG